MSEHLKTRIIRRLASACATFVKLPPTATPHKRGVHYFRIDMGIGTLSGAVDMEAEGRKCRKRIIVRPSRFRNGLCELYAYRFPEHWSDACLANRRLIKEAQRRAHALERDYSVEAIEWRIRFFHHYFTVVKGGAKPEPGLKPYSRFYQYTYVCIYRRLQEEARKEQELQSSAGAQPEDVSFEPVFTDRPDALPSSRMNAFRLSRSSRCSRIFLRPLENPPKMRSPQYICTDNMFLT